MEIAERRTEKRSLFTAAVDYSYNYAENDTLVCRTAVGIATNLSPWGLGFYTYAPLEHSQGVTLFCRQLHPEPIVAEARWCKQVSGKLFRAGLMFSRQLTEPPLLTEEVPEKAAREVLKEQKISKEKEVSKEKAFWKEAPVAPEDWKGAIEMLKAHIEVLENRFEGQMLELLAANEKLQTLSVTDDLTGLHNRRYFYERLEAERNLLDRYGHTLSIMLLDIDDFKSVNDMFGHLAGDALLVEFADIVKGSLRKGDIFTRYGGEEFAAILPHTGGAAALTAAENIRRTVAATDFRAIEGKKRITVSIGVTEIGRGIKDSSEAVRQADGALYEAKRKGKNTALLWPEGA